MTQIEPKISKLITSSLFLSEKKKEELKELLKSATPAEKEDLLQLLESEKEAAKEFTQKMIEQKGPEAITDLNRIVHKGKREVSKGQEKEDRQKESKQLDQLTKDLETL
jgi:hypothetical protein